MTLPRTAVRMRLPLTTRLGLPRMGHAVAHAFNRSHRSVILVTPPRAASRAGCGLIGTRVSSDRQAGAAGIDEGGSGYIPAISASASRRRRGLPKQDAVRRSCGPTLICEATPTLTQQALCFVLSQFAAPKVHQHVEKSHGSNNQTVIFAEGFDFLVVRV